MTYPLATMSKVEQGRRQKPRNPRAIRLKQAPRRVSGGLEDMLLDLVRRSTPGANEDVVADAVRRAEEWLSYASVWNLKNWETTIARDLGVDLRGLATVMSSDPEVRVAFAWLLELITDLHRQTLSKLRLAAVAAEALPGGTVALTREAVSKVITAQRRRAKLIAHDQAQKILAKINERQQVEAGVTRYKWNHSFLPNPRRHHVERQGNTYSWSRPPRGGHPGTEINCRCTAEPVIE